MLPRPNASRSNPDRRAGFLETLQQGTFRLGKDGPLTKSQRHKRRPVFESVVRCCQVEGLPRIFFVAVDQVMPVCGLRIAIPAGQTSDTFDVVVTPPIHGGRRNCLGSVVTKKPMLPAVRNTVLPSRFSREPHLVFFFFS